ncbi:Acetoacetate decarboxylase [Burkholderia sp. lig30]|jgi:acetoacetate decarboxylase|uniref:acetoacetate decarboxylase family protein n=1 Tax=Burkholderia sp. lig30 TaxID=1192124 RepID=UPI000460B870|nr:acetoacetate decarboxylase family protein [Burkholderia sp. lig30]KDB10192.1 Acetoacetate decarboxylase [Burkholderia sp. lig30]
MPTHFGPAPGPRQLPDGLSADPDRKPKRMTVAASFLTDTASLERHLPKNFALAGEPVVTVEFHYLTEVDWLAGRGYTMVHVSWPAVFTGLRDSASGKFLAVAWENLADPIITGRDEIGHPKLYADVLAPRSFGGSELCEAGWMGFRFLELAVGALVQAPTDGALNGSDGTLMLKYKPRTGEWGAADLCEVTLTPSHDPHVTIERRYTGDARLHFHRATWSDLPTMAHVVNALADLPVLEMRGGTVVHAHGGKSYRDQRVLR